MAEYRHLGSPDGKSPQPGLDIKEFDVPARDTHHVRVRSYRNSGSFAISGNDPLPLLIWFHRGGFVIGDLETDDVSCRAIAADADVLVLNIEYRLAPKHPFPVGFADCLDIVNWASSSTNLNVDLSKGFILGGTSAGANFAAGIAHILAQDATAQAANFKPVTGLLFLAGTMCHEDGQPAQFRERLLSIDEITIGPGLTKEVIRYLSEKYAVPPTDPRRSPLLFESHANLALRAAVYACGWDPRRDETLLLEELLRGEGVRTRNFVYPGLPHGFWMTYPGLDESKQWEKDLLEGVRFLLGEDSAT